MTPKFLLLCTAGHLASECVRGQGAIKKYAQWNLWRLLSNALRFHSQARQSEDTRPVHTHGFCHVEINLARNRPACMKHNPMAMVFAARIKKPFLLPHSLGQGKDTFVSRAYSCRQPSVTTHRPCMHVVRLLVTYHKNRSPTSHQNLPSAPYRPTGGTFLLFSSSISILGATTLSYLSFSMSAVPNVVHHSALERRLKLSHALCSRSRNFRTKKDFASDVCADAKCHAVP